MARRERVMMLEPFGKRHHGNTCTTVMRSAAKIRVRRHSGDEAARSDGRARRGDHRSHVGEFEPDKFEDATNAMIELIRSKQAGLPAPTEKASARLPTSST